MQSNFFAVTLSLILELYLVSIFGIKGQVIEA